MLYSFFYHFFLYSFIGWTTEVIYAFIYHKRFINRGFLYGPLCPIYGTGMAILLLIFDTLNQNNIFDFYSSYIGIFVFVFFFSSIVEYIVGMALDKMFNTRWWDYSERKYNLNGFICLRFSIMWGIGGILVIKVLNPMVEAFIDMIPTQTGETILRILLAYLLIDILFTIKALADYKVIIGKMQNLSKDISESILENIEELEEKGLLFTEEMYARFQDLKSDIKSQTEYFHDQVYKKYITYIGNISINEIGDELKKDFMELRRARRENGKNSLSIYNQLRTRLSKSHLTKAYPKAKSNRFAKTLKSIKEYRNGNR
ncbi:putative ABC transporter permease [Alkalibacter saccharofermentans]|uniref:Uncharacterized membrane protein n=1 Tax=Alkalibacter saccharofermentans DSM 14828 TaxID=1120975 RepID=A0A1M4TDX8_9FIRM|nr:putative ABC transporter permease [Alkalibacter saccharofermentans]SHE42759.1 Uncharacterized membrane protein [Alkalibacter saccharofermentans DSM 14828]